MSDKKYFLLDLLDLLLEPFVFDLGCFVLLLQFASVDFLQTSHSSFDEVNRVSWLLWLLIQVDQDLGELVYCSCLFEVLLELLFFAFDSTLASLESTCDIEDKF